MSSYVESVLQPGETVAFTSNIHWLIYLRPIALALVALAGLALWLFLRRESDQVTVSFYLAYAMMGFGGFLALTGFLAAWFTRWTTEIAVTTRRVIYKRGFIRRVTIEMNMDKVESIDVHQSILGRMFNYGDIIVRGTGAGLEPLHMIEKPIAFRNAVIAR
ncbi:MAG: PH domain-containing protein [Candidatus Binataceae bacterium]